MKQDMLKNGYVCSPNNIHSLPGDIMYANGPGCPQYPSSHQVQVLPDRIRVFTNRFFGQDYSKNSYWDQVTVAVFDSVGAFITSCPEVSKGGINHLTGPNVFD